MKRPTFSSTSLEVSNGVFHFMGQYCFTIVLALSLSIGLSSCEKKQETPDWNKTLSQADTDTQDDPQVQKKSSDRTLDKLDIEKKKETIAALEADKKTLRFVHYNIRNYLTMQRGQTEEFKPEQEVKALIGNIVRANPDILGVCEIGTQKDLDHLVERLKEAGIHFPHSYLSKGADLNRRLALLSKYPIQKHEVPKYTYMMMGEEHEMRRGILDATVVTPIGNIRFLGAHLKSKRPIAIYDEAEIRREEALILRKHASEILADSGEKLLVFGDMNDTKGSSTIRLLRGPKDKQLTAIELFDKQGTKWTQYWAREDIYSRFDFIFVSSALLPSINQQNSFVLDTPPGDLASDHRALVVIIE